MITVQPLPKSVALYGIEELLTVRIDTKIFPRKNEN